MKRILAIVAILGLFLVGKSIAGVDYGDGGSYYITSQATSTLILSSATFGGLKQTIILDSVEYSSHSTAGTYFILLDTSPDCYWSNGSKLYPEATIAADSALMLTGGKIQFSSTTVSTAWLNGSFAAIPSQQVYLFNAGRGTTVKSGGVALIQAAVGGTVKLNYRVR